MLRVILDYLQTVMTSSTFFLSNLVFLAGLVLLLNQPPKTRREWGVQALELLGIFAVWFVTWAIVRACSDSALVGICADAIAALVCCVLLRGYSIPIRLICSVTYLSAVTILCGLAVQIANLNLLGSASEVVSSALLSCLATVGVILFLRHWHIGTAESPPYRLCHSDDDHLCSLRSAAAL